MVSIDLREFVWETSVILAQAREEGGPKIRKKGGVGGIRGAHTLHWPTFYACPRHPSESGSFFLKKTLLVRVLCTFFYFCDTSRLKTRFLTGSLFCVDFGAILAPFWRPKWYQNGTWRLKSDLQKLIEFLFAFW